MSPILVLPTYFTLFCSVCLHYSSRILLRTRTISPARKGASNPICLVHTTPLVHCPPTLARLQLQLGEKHCAASLCSMPSSSIYSYIFSNASLSLKHVSNNLAAIRTELFWLLALRRPPITHYHLHNGSVTSTTPRRHDMSFPTLHPRLLTHSPHIPWDARR